MTIDLVALAARYLSPDIMGKLAGLIGESSGRTGSMVTAAVPLLVAAMGNNAAPAGLDAIARAVSPGGGVAPGMLDGLGRLFGDPAAAASAQAAGAGLLTTLFGGHADTLARVLAGSTRSTARSAGTLLGLLTPVVVGAIGSALAEQRREATRDNVHALLHDNKASAVAALPLGVKGVLATIPGAALLVGASVARTRRRNLIILLLALLALLLGLWALLMRDRVDVDTCNDLFKQAFAGRTVNFDTADATISPDSKALLDDLGRVANRCRAYKIEVAGHTDSVGDAAMNQSLSQRRAAAVVNYLAASGVRTGQMTAAGYGEARPAVPTADETPMEANRRIEFTVSR